MEMIIVIDKNLPDTMLPRYQCHKKVWALKIAAIEFTENGDAKLAPENNRYGPFEVKNYRAKFKGFDDRLGKDLGYYVQYDDGYQSWSPTKAFEEGYTKI